MQSSEALDDFLTCSGVGKTMIAAFDYKRFRETAKRSRLLFIAHRKEILEQSIQTFQAVLNDYNFGELYVDGSKPKKIEYLFMSIQSFNSAKFTEWTTSDFYDYIIVDEFHHSAAKLYQDLLSFYKPKILLGLTATPDRMDGKDILKYFDGRIASRMLLGEAIDRNLLSTFQYFGVTDEIDYYLVQQKIDKSLFTDQLIDDMAYHYYKNCYYYEMDDEYAVLAAVSVVLEENMISIDGFQKWIP